MRLQKFLLILPLAILVYPVAGLQAQGRQFEVFTGAVEDRVTIQSEGEGAIVDIYSSTGRGKAEINIPSTPWPKSIRIRLRGLPQLERFRASGNGEQLICDLIRKEGKEPAYACLLGKKKIPVIRRSEKYFEITLPPLLLDPRPTSLSIEWADYWRR